MTTDPAVDLTDILRLVASMVPWHKRTAQRLGGSFTTVLALDTEEEDGLDPVALRRVGRLVAENVSGLDADEILACRAVLGPLAREVARLRARLVEVEGERDAARVDLAWHEQMNGTRAEQEAHDAEADAVDAAAEALTPEQIRAEMLEIGLDPDRVEREAEVSARLIVRWMQARDERDAARAEIEELRLTLAAEQGRPEGAPSEGWRWCDGVWSKDFPHGHHVRIMLAAGAGGSIMHVHHATEPHRRIAADSARAAMIAADKATT